MTLFPLHTFIHNITHFIICFYCNIYCFKDKREFQKFILIKLPQCVIIITLHDKEQLQCKKRSVNYLPV